jgi:hypothetical protein
MLAMPDLERRTLLLDRGGAKINARSKRPLLGIAWSPRNIPMRRQ